MTINYAVLQNTVFPASTPTPQTLRKNVDGILEAYGTQIPIDGAAGYLPGCIFIKTSGSGDNTVYVNEGSSTSADFNSVKNVPDAYGTASGRGPSPAIWDGADILRATLDPTFGMHYFNDFLSGPVGANNASDYTGGEDDIIWITGATAGSVITPQVDEPTGVIRLETTTINEHVAIGALAGGHVAGNFLPSRTWAWEARISLLNITGSKFAAFIGFAEEAKMASGGVIAAGTPWAMADVDFFGFHRINADGVYLDTMHNTNGGGGLTTVASDAVTIAADTFIKVGAKSDGTTVTFYADGVLLADEVLLSATNFPEDQEMAFYFVLESGHGDICSVEIDWIRIYQQY